MSWYDLKDKAADSATGSVAFGGLLAKLIGAFWLGAFIGVYLGVSPFWEPAPGAIFGRFWFAFWCAAPLGIFGGWVYLHWRVRHDRVKRDKREAEIAAAVAAVKPQPVAEAAPQEPREKTFTGLYFGTSTGELLSRSHVAGLPQGEALYAAKEDACKNTIIFGGIGSGKTTRAINPLLQQVFEQQAGALILDIKADFSREVGYIANLTGRSYVTVGHGGLTLNLIRGTSPELAASYLKSCFIASGSAGGSGAFFVDQAVELCRNALTLLVLTDGDYSLAAVYDLVFSAPKREAGIAEMLSRGEQYDKRQFRLAESVGNYFANVHGTFDDKMLSNVNATVAQVLSPFSHPDLIDAFSGGESEGEADLTALLSGAIYFVSLPMTLFGKEGARYAYMLIKLRFMSLMRERRTRTDWNQDVPVAFVCDEYQSVVDSITDTDFWDKSRSSGCFGVVSMQGVASLYQAVGSKQAADAILQNFRQRLVFRTEDDATMSMVQRLLGQVDVFITSTSEGSSHSMSGSDWRPQTGGEAFAGAMTLGLGAPTGPQSTSQGTSYSESTSMQRQQLFDSNDFRSLNTDYALFLGNIGDRAVDEVIQMQPLYVKAQPAAQQPAVA